MNEKYHLFTKSSIVVLHGTSGSGITTLHWCNYLTNLVKSGKVFCAPDSANMYETISVKKKLPQFKWALKNLYKLVN
jgi:hypothetical protein